MPPQGVHLLKLANSRIISGEFKAAQGLLLDCIKLYPNFTEPYMSLVAVFKQIGQDTKALHLYAMALHMKPSDSTIAFECAQLSSGALCGAVTWKGKSMQQKYNDTISNLHA
jgi:Tfp pilus assembly protein PilF